MVKKYIKAYEVIRAQGRGAFTAIAKKMGKSPSGVSMCLRLGRPHFHAQFDYTEAINELFGTKYTREELFLSK